MIEKKRVVKQTAKGDNNIQVSGDLVLKFPEDVQAVFDEAVTLINDGKAQVAQLLLERTWRYQNDAMRPQQKSNCRRLLGCALERQEKYEEAGRHFLDAKDLDPTWEKARTFEAVGYLCLGNLEKARSVAESVLQEFGQNVTAWSVWIRTAGDIISFDEIEGKVPTHLREDADITMALGMAAAIKGDYEKAEQLVAATQKRVPDNPRVTERLANLLFERAAINEQVHQRRNPSDKERTFLRQAIKLYTDALKNWTKEASINGIIRVRLARAWAYATLLEEEKARADVEGAYELGATDPTVVYSYAVFIGDENLDAGIEALGKVVGKDNKPAVEHLLAQMLHRRNRGSDRSEALALLKSRLKDLDAIPESARFDYIESLIEVEVGQSNLKCALETLQSVTQGVLGARMRAMLQSNAMWLGEEREGALRIAKELYDTLDQSATYDEKRELANLLRVIGLHREGLRIWKSIVRTDSIGSDTFKMIDCAEQCGAENDVLELAAGLRANGVWDRRIFEYEVYLRQKYNDWRECKRILQDYIRSPRDKEYLPYAKAHLSHVAGVLGEPQLIETDVSQLPPPQEVAGGMGRLIVQALRLAGEPLKAADYAYELVRTHFASIDAHLAVTSFMIPLGPKQLEMDPGVVVRPGMAVQYKESHGDAPVWHIIEDSKVMTPEESRNEYLLEHPYSQKMLGLKKGDSFLLRAGSIQERKATILEVVSKYHYRTGDCVDAFEKRFPDHPAIIKIKAYHEDGQIDLDPMRRLADLGEAAGKELLQSYKEHHLPIYFLAAQKGRDLFTTLGHLISLPDTEIHCRRGHPSEVEAAVRKLKDAKEIVLDEMSLATLLFCDACEHLAKIPKKLVVSHGTLLCVENWEVTRIDPDSPGMTAGNVDGKLVFVPRSKGEVEHIQAKIRTLTEFIRERCVVESGVLLSFFDASQRDLFTKVLGEACAETMAISRVGRRVLWTDDLTCAALYTQELGGARVWTELVFLYLAGQDLLDPPTVRGLILRLVSYRYWFTSLNGDIAVDAVIDSDWNLDRSPLKEVLAHFGDRRVTLDDNFMRMIARLLKHCWSQDRIGLRASGVTVRILNELRKRGDVAAPLLVDALWVWIRRVFGLDLVTAHQIKGVLQNWLQGYGGGIIIP